MALGNRAAAEATVLKWVEEILPGGGNAELYKELFAGMNDQQFDEWIQDLESKKAHVRIFVPPMREASMNPTRNLEVGKKMGVEFFQRLWLTDPVTGRTTLTPKKYLIVHLPLRRQQQLLVKKISVPDDNLHVNELTGQPTGVSKGAGLSYPEWQIFYAKGLNYTGLELAKLRGGDTKAFREMNRQIARTGTANMSEILRMGTRPESTITLNTILKSMLLDNNL
jgi:hypothetical protein